MSGASERCQDVLVVGAGIVGCAVARECLHAGLSVAIVDRAQPGAGATAAAMGHIVLMEDSPALLALTLYGRKLWQDLAPELPPSTEYTAPGTLWLAADEGEMGEVRSRQTICAEAGLPCCVLDGGEVVDLEPRLRPGLAGGLLVEQDAIVSPPSAAEFLLREAEKRGAVVHRQARAVAAGRGSVLFADGSRLQAGAVVLATGCDTTLAPWLPIRPRKGHLLLTTPQPGFARHQLVEMGYRKSAHQSDADSVAFNLQPRASGELLIGSSRQYGAADAAVEPGIVRAMLARAIDFTPSLAAVSIVREWTGFRAATPDGLPLLGPAQHPDASQDTTLYLTMGFEGLGITTSLAGARLIVDRILGRRPAIDPEPYAPRRLAAGADKTIFIEETQ